MTAATRAALDGHAPPEILPSVFDSATVNDALAILVAESRDGTARLRHAAIATAAIDLAGGATATTFAARQGESSR